MTELIFSERFLKFIKVAFSQQIEAGKMKPAYIFESDIDSPFNRVGALEVELRQNKVNGNIEELRNEINSLKEWIEFVHDQGKKINALHGEGKTELKYQNYSYSVDKFTLLAHSPDVKFKFTLHHDYFAIIEYFRQVYKLLEIVVPAAGIVNNEIDNILIEIFPGETSDRIAKFKKLLFNENEVGYLSLTYVGTKVNLWKQLNKLCKAGINRQIIADVFSEKMRYQKRIGGNEEVLKWDEVYNKC